MDQRSINRRSDDVDALIDLLASDDIHDIAVAASDPSHSPRRNVHLRDASGKLDFDKICLMFAKQNLGVGASDDTHNLPVQRETDSQDALSRSGLSRSVSSSSQSSERRQGSRLPSSNSPASLGINIQNRHKQTPQSPASIRESHSCSSSESNRNGSHEGKDPPCRNPLSSQPLIVNPVPPNDMPFPHQACSMAEKTATRPAGSTTPLMTSFSSDECRVQDLTKPLQFEQTNDALSRATSEVDALREQYEQLRALVAEWLPQSKKSHPGKPSAQLSGNHVTLSSRAQASAAESGLHSDVISQLSEYEAKKILTRLVTSLRLSPHSIRDLLPEGEDVGSDPVFPSPSGVEDIKSSMEFLASVDELVWKRSMSLNGGGPDPLYSTANTDALMQRLFLWEKTVRGPHRE